MTPDSLSPEAINELVDTGRLPAVKLDPADEAVRLERLADEAESL